MSYIAYAIVIMAVVTYITRVVPLIIVKQKIKSKFIMSALYYIPYTVLAAMTFPAIIYSTPSIASAVFGLVVALVLAYFNRGLMTVATFCVLSVLLMEYLIKFF